MPKRKAGDEKYYAVRVGVAPGVYRTWDECQAQITGFKGAIFKSFETQEDALAFVAGRTPPSENNSSNKKAKGEKFYAVANGRQPGIYADWDSASAAILGTKGPRYKKFPSRAEAEKFILEHGSLETIQSLGLVSKHWAGEGEGDGDAAADNVWTESGFAPVAADGVPVATIAEDQEAPVAGFHDGWLHIYTDGACRGNGKRSSKGGVGVFFGKGDKRNIGERLRGEAHTHTNQRAELEAILRALQVAPRATNVLILTDSNYSIQCVTNWCHGWRRNGWKNAKGVDVLNQDLIKGVLALFDERKKRGGRTEFRWVKGHAQNAGNIEADRLAVQGASGW